VHANDYGIVVRLEIAFAQKSIRQTCERFARAKLLLGTKVAEKLKRRLADLRAATHVADLVAGHPNDTNGRHRRISIDLCEGYQLILGPNHTSTPVDASGRVDWSKVSRIKLFAIRKRDK
jgi:hypothetical protein